MRKQRSLGAMLEAFYHILFTELFRKLEIDLDIDQNYKSQEKGYSDAINDQCACFYQKPEHCQPSYFYFQEISN